MGSLSPQDRWSRQSRDRGIPDGRGHRRRDGWLRGIPACGRVGGPGGLDQERAAAHRLRAGTVVLRATAGPVGRPVVGRRRRGRGARRAAGGRGGPEGCRAACRRAYAGSETGHGPAAGRPGAGAAGRRGRGVDAGRRLPGSWRVRRAHARFDESARRAARGRSGRGGSRGDGGPASRGRGGRPGYRPGRGGAQVRFRGGGDARRLPGCRARAERPRDHPWHRGRARRRGARWRGAARCLGRQERDQRGRRRRGGPDPR